MRVHINHAYQWLRHKGVLALTAVIVLASVVPGVVTQQASAETNNVDFNIQVSPSPLVLHLTPGASQTATLTVRNFSNHAETLYPHLNGFSIDRYSKNIKLLETSPVNMASWVRFNDSVLALPAGSTKQLVITFNTPGDVGFSYSAAITLSRSQNAPVQGDGVHTRGTVAVFCLVNINRSDAKSKLGISHITSDKGSYQFLPAHFGIDIENQGNIINQPTGSLFIQRSFDSAKPIATMPINSANSYILPGTIRHFTIDWNNGFPAYVKNADGTQHLNWDWKHLNELRFGRYVAKAVVTYNDGHRDVPLVTSTTFWIIPWTFILTMIVIIVVLAMGIVGWGKLLFKGTRKVHTYAARRK